MTLLFTIFASFFFQVYAETAEILIVPKGTNLNFWRLVEKGAKKASLEYKTPIIWRGPVDDWDIKAQVKIAERYLNSEIKVLVLAPAHEQALTTVAQKFKKKGKKVIVFDSALKGNLHDSFIATDNFNSGLLIGNYFATLIPPNGKIMVARNLKGSDSTDKRVSGFIQAIKESKKNIHIVTNNQGVAKVRSSLHHTLDSLKLTPGIVGIFAPNESTMEGVIRATKRLNRKDLILAGFDINKTIYNALKEGMVKALILQDPVEMGYQSTSLAIKLLKDQPIKKRITLPSLLVTGENYQKTEIVNLIRQMIGQ